jgi:hypothetical protein
MLWGMVEYKEGTRTHSNVGRHFANAVKWYHRAKHKGILPPPFNELAKLCRERKTFTVEKRYRTPPPPKAVVDDKATWTAEQWREWNAIEND